MIKNLKKMKTEFDKLEQEKGNYSHNELHDLVCDLTSEIIATDSRLLSIDKRWKGYGTWISVGFANKYHFGDTLAELITKALNGRITHDEDRNFDVSDFEEEIRDKIFDYLYD